MDIHLLQFTSSPECLWATKKHDYLELGFVGFLHIINSASSPASWEMEPFLSHCVWKAYDQISRSRHNLIDVPNTPQAPTKSRELLISLLSK